ncbi:MAG: hypothetical protein QXT43_00150 [Candidatus Micrarchaeaceae archaeon]
MLYIKPTGKNLLRAYSLLRAHFGFLNWWPASTDDEMLIGAILTQNTSWKNVEKAIAELRRRRMLSIKSLSRANARSIERAIRSSGFYRQKAQRLKLFARTIAAYGSFKKFVKQSADARQSLLGIKGIGKETADSMLLYAGSMPFFVVDAYTKRVMRRLFGVDMSDYDMLQKFIARRIPEDVGLYKDFHAQFVELAKNFCRKEPLCGACPLRNICNFKKHLYA